MNYGEKLKYLRDYDLISQREVAEALGIARSSYNQFEQQYDIMPIKRLNQAANFFNVSIDYLFGFTEKLNYPQNKEEINMELASKRLKSWRKLHKLTQVKLAKSIKATPSVIIQHESKRTTLGTPFLYDLCKTYNLSADYLLGKSDIEKPSK